MTDEVTAILTERIRRGELPVGSWLPAEKVMADQFAVSRTVIREAISRLKSEGLVETRQGKGAAVRPANSAIPFRISLNDRDPLRSVLRLLELRGSLEAEIASLAAQRRTKPQMAAIKRSFAAIDFAMTSGRDGVAEDVEFHLSIARATGNPYFEDLISFIAPFLFNSIVLTRTDPKLRAAFAKQTREEHCAIVEAISQKTPAQAVAAARSHMANVAARVQSIKSTSRTA